MLIYIVHSDRIYTFRLPKNISGNYVLHDYDIYGLKRSLVNIYAADGKWILNSNNDIKINVNGKYIENIELKEYCFYSLKVYKTESVLLYVNPSCQNDYVTKSILDNSSIIIGNDSNADILYSYPCIAKKQIELKYVNGRWSFKNLNPSIPIYINKVRKDYGNLSNFDMIFIMGMKILICNKLLLISCPPALYHFVSQKFSDEIKELAVPLYENNSLVFKDFYDVGDYFYKSPIFRKKYTALELVITSPEAKENKDSGSFLMSIVPSVLMSMTTVLTAYYSLKNYKSGTTTDKESLITSLVMCAVMLVTSIVWPFVEKIANDIRRFINNRKRTFIYNKYLKKKRKELDIAKNEQKMTLEFNNVSLKECQEVIQKRNAYLFSRNIGHDDFLTVKLGTGKVKLDCHTDYKKPDFLAEKDKLLTSIDKMLSDYEYIEDAPYTISIKKNRCVAFISEMINYEDYMNAIILQLVTLQDYSELKLVILTSEVSSDLNRIRELNHCWDDERSIRFFANNIHDAENLSSYLLKIYNSRINSQNSNTKNKYSTYYLIVSDNINYYKNLKIVNSILDSENDVGFGIIMFSKKITEIPEGCQTFINYNEKEATTFQVEMNEKNINKYVPNFVDKDVDFNLCMRLVSNIPIMLNNESRGTLPEKLGFLELYGVGNVEQLNSINRWKTSPIINTLSAPIGVDSIGNTLCLDLHEKKHGPHGLIAGMTGSGKSEFIVTYILSLAVNYSPYEVQFVLIDYKGGGLAGAFENRKTGVKLPHLVGTITNLDKSSMNRTLVSIQSELQRRQRVFNEAKETLNTGTIDIYKYQKLVREGALKNPLSHLFIICDEFAELKAQQPDFMEQLVSAARIGRSLGIHLILATQKPSGVVDDQIWSNSKFKVCCKVQTAEDSKEMIRRDDAAYIKESGRFYLQVGYDEIFVKGQSAYTGTQYIPSETVTINVNDSIEFLDDVGNITRTVVREEQKQSKVNEDLGEELGNVLQYLIQCAKKIGFQNQQLWLDNVPTNLYLEDLRKKYPSEITKYIINPLIGEYDDPQNQKQGPVFVNLTKNGNVMISGNYGGGKTTLTATMIYSSIITHNTDELNIYIIDFLAETLKMFSKAPQVGDFISVVDRDKLSKLFHFLNKEIVKRKKYFSNKGGSYFGVVNRGNVPFSNIIVVINGMDVFKETYDEIFEELFTPLTRDCNRVGITFVVTTTSSLPAAVESNFPQKIALRYLDVSEYSMIFNDTRGIIPGSNPGRGLIELDAVYEFQSAIIFNELSMERNLSYVINQLCQFLKKAPSVPTMPRIVTFDSVKNEITSLDMVPIGVELSSNCVCSYDFTNFITPIIYSNIKNITTFEISLLKVFKYVENTKVFVLDTLGTLEDIEGINIYTSNFKKLCKALHQNIIKKKTKDPSAEKIVFVISGYQKLQQHLDLMKKEDDTIITIDDLILESKDTANFKFIIINDYKLKSVDDKEWSDYLDSGNGIVIAMEKDSQDLIDYEDSYDEIKINKDIAIVIKDSKKNYIKYVRNRS